jgi:hypothetical protein
LPVKTLKQTVSNDYHGENVMSKKQKEEVGIVESIEVSVNKKRGNASFEIKHDVNGKETMTITCKDENGKEVKIEVPWEKVRQLKK